MEEVKINKEKSVNDMRNPVVKYICLVVETALTGKAIGLTKEIKYCTIKLTTASWITSIYWKYRLHKVSKKVRALIRSIEQWNDIKEKEGYGTE